jgi:hypothetical protein
MSITRSGSTTRGMRLALSRMRRVAVGLGARQPEHADRQVLADDVVDRRLERAGELLRPGRELEVEPCCGRSDLGAGDKGGVVAPDDPVHHVLGRVQAHDQVGPP